MQAEEEGNSVNHSVAMDSVADKVEVVPVDQPVLPAIDQPEQTPPKENNHQAAKVLEEKKTNFKRYNQWRQEKTNKIHEVSVLHQNVLKRLDANMRQSDDTNKYINEFFEEQLRVVRSHVALLKKNRAAQLKKQQKQSKGRTYYDQLDQLLMKVNQNLDTDIHQQQDYLNFITNNVKVKLAQERKDFKAAVAKHQKVILSKSSMIKRQEKLVSKMNIKFTANFIQMVKSQSSKQDFFVEEMALIQEQGRFDQAMGQMGTAIVGYVGLLETLEKTRVEMYRQVYSDYITKQRLTFGDTPHLKQLQMILQNIDVQKELASVKEVLTPDDRTRLEKSLEDKPFDQKDLILATVETERDVATFGTEFKRSRLTFTIDGHLLIQEDDGQGHKTSHQLKSHSLQLLPKKNNTFQLMGISNGFFGDSTQKLTLRITDLDAAKQMKDQIEKHSSKG